MILIRKEYLEEGLPLSLAELSYENLRWLLRQNNGLIYNESVQAVYEYAYELHKIFKRYGIHKDNIHNLILINKERFKGKLATLELFECSIFNSMVRQSLLIYSKTPNISKEIASSILRVCKYLEDDQDYAKAQQF